MNKFLLANIALLLGLILTGCSISGRADRNTTTVPEVSFKTHIIQFGGIHSAIYDGVYWNISSLEAPFPAMDSAINDLPKNLVKIEYRGRKDYFNIRCPENFRIMECEINKNKVDVTDNSCQFFFPTEEVSNSDISFICNNGKLESPI